MSVRTFDPRPPEIFKPALCSAGCGREYYSICRYCNLAFCFDHLKNLPHVCDTKESHDVPTHEEFHELYGDLQVVELEIVEDKKFYMSRKDLVSGCCALPEVWDSAPKGCAARQPETGEICQLPVDGHNVHKREHPNGTELQCWIEIPPKNGKGVVGG